MINDFFGKFLKKQNRKPMIIFGLGLIAVIAWFCVIYTPLNIENAVSVSVQKGEGLMEVASSLKKAGVINSKYAFATHITLQGKQNNLIAGFYQFSGKNSLASVAKIIIGGKIATETLTIIEGWTIRDFANLLKEKGIFQFEEVFGVIGYPAINALTPNEDLVMPKDFSNVFPLLADKPTFVSLEGYLFPDTYKINKSDSLENILRKILTNFESKITKEMLNEISRQGKTIFEIITMASMLEKELISYQDKQIGSGILWKRAQKGWPLQVDASLVYLTNRPDNAIYEEDFDIPSFYNTYKYQGLPLGPICNPGFESIMAAIYPQESAYWFYLSAPDGQTIFSKTLEEHNANRRKYLK